MFYIYRMHQYIPSNHASLQLCKRKLSFYANKVDVLSFELENEKVNVLVNEWPLVGTPQTKNEFRLSVFYQQCNKCFQFLPQGICFYCDFCLQCRNATHFPSFCYEKWVQWPMKLPINIPTNYRSLFGVATLNRIMNFVKLHHNTVLYILFKRAGLLKYLRKYSAWYFNPSQYMWRIFVSNLLQN